MRKRSSYRQINRRLERLERAQSTMAPLNEEEEQKFLEALKFHSETGSYPDNEYGDFIRTFEENF